MALGSAALWSSFRPARGTPAAPPYLTIFLIDGLSQDLFDQELAAGQLPAISQLMDEGLYVPHGIASFPSMTGYGFYPLLTGRDAAGSGILGLRWFDDTRCLANFRNYVGLTGGAMTRDFTPSPATLFECFPADHSYSINSYASRGAGQAELTTWQFTAAKYHERHWLVRALSRIPTLGPRIVPDWFRAESTVVQRALADLAYRPKVQWITFASPDAYQHMEGSGERYAALVRHLDGLIALYRRESKALGLERDRLYLVASDHGVVDVQQNVDLRVVLTSLGLRVWRGEATYFLESQLERPTRFWADDDVVIAINGNTMNYVYLRSQRARERRADIARTLRTTRGVELVVSRAEKGTVTIEDSEGQSAIGRDGEELTYAVTGGRDPLGYCAADGRPAFCDGAALSPEAWLAATHGDRFPYAVPRLHALMTQPHVGDFVVTAAPGFDLAEDYELVVGNYRGGHGGLRADQLRVPYVVAGPGVAPGQRRETARAEDVGQLVRGLLGCPRDAIR